jgi:peptidyl-dipeptidase Dcp
VKFAASPQQSAIAFGDYLLEGSRSMKAPLALALATALGCGSTPYVHAADTPADETQAANPFFTPSKLAYQMPPFDRIRDEHFAPALERGMAEQRAEIEAIATQEDEPTFENTIVAMERSGELLRRVSPVFSNLVGAHTNDTLNQVQREFAPKSAAHTDAILLNDALFARVSALYEQRKALELDPESTNLIERYYTDFVRAGARLSAEDKEKLKGLNSELASLSSTFGQNVLKEVNASALLVDSRDELAGLSDAAIKAAADAAREAGHEGKFLLALQNTSQQPPLSSLSHRPTRQRMLEASLTRGARGGEFDNREVVMRTVRLRAERAQLLGYPNHAAYSLEDQTAGTTDAVNKLLAELAPPAVANARREAADLQKMIASEGEDFDLAAWDWNFYAEKVRQARFEFDEEQLRPYLELDRVLVDGVFFAANKLYGLTFKERTDLPVYLPEVRVWEVFDADGSPLALFLGDFYARPSKRGGAWMNAYVSQNTLLGDRPVVGNHQNIPKPPAGEPTLMTMTEVNTMFHEFGHALHGMFSNVRYPRFSGTRVPRDFVEFPSQVNEMWATWPEVLANYARHHQTGEPIPQDLVDKVQAAEQFNQGYMTTEYLAAALLDQRWHQMTPDQIPRDALAFEARALRDANVALPTVPPRYRTTYFSHIFSGGYSAGYYAYIWSEVLDADTVEWFKEKGGLTRENGEHFRRTLLSRGGSDDAMNLFRDFRGRDPELRPLLMRRGLDEPVVD